MQAENDKLLAALDLMTKHAKEGWDLANTRTAQWKAVELQLSEATGLLAELTYANEHPFKGFVEIRERCLIYLKTRAEKRVELPQMGDCVFCSWMGPGKLYAPCPKHAELHP